MAVLALNFALAWPKFRAKQADVIEAALQSKDSCVLWPTGSGKSICYQLPALYAKKTVFIVSPLISLMTDQVKISATDLKLYVDHAATAAYMHARISHEIEQ